MKMEYMNYFGVKTEVRDVNEVKNYDAMRISDLITLLENLKEKHGDLYVYIEEGDNYYSYFMKRSAVSVDHVEFSPDSNTPYIQRFNVVKIMNS